MSIHVSSRVWRSCSQKGDRLLLMLALADYSNDEGYCWPSQASLAKRCRCSERGVQRMIDALIEEGEMELIKPGGGRGKSAVYLLVRYSEQGVLTSFEKGDPGATKGDPGAEKGRSHAGESVSEPKQSISTTVNNESVVKIYDAYPRKIAKPAALRAIRKALKKVDADKLLEVTQQYAKAMNGGDPRFIPYPQKWFNEERYNDDPKTWIHSEDKKTSKPSSINSTNSNRDAIAQYR